MATNRQEEMTPGQTFVDASGRRRWKSRVPGMEDVSEENIETAEILPLASLRSALSEEDTGSGADASSALSKPSAAAQARSADMNERDKLRRTQEAETETFPEISPVFRSPSLAAMPWASETDEQESTAARAAGKSEDQLRRERFLQAYRDTYGLVPPVGHPSLDGIEAPRSADVASPITAASTPVEADVPGAVTVAAPSKTLSPAPKMSETANVAAPIPAVSSAGTTAIAPTTPGASKPSPVETGSGGDDEMASLRRRLGLLQAFEGVGSAASGKNLRTDGGILVDRMKQIEALRAKKLQTAEERALEASTWGASNRATLASALAQWKGDPEKTAALEALASGADTTKPGDFSRNVVNAVMTKPKVLGVEATTGKTEAGTDTAKARTKTEDLLREPKARKLGTAADLDAARIRALNAKSAADALALTKSRAAVADAGKAGTPSREAIKYIRDDLKTAEKAITPTLENFKAIESVSPGFAFGRPDKQLETLEFVAASKVPRFAKQASDLRSAVEALIIDIRHGSFGASLTATEKASFESMLNTGLSGTVGQLSKAIDRVRRKAAATAQTHFNTSQQFYPTETQQVLSTSAVFGPATRKGGVYADVWTLPEAPAAAGGGVEPSAPKVPTESQIAKLRANPDRAADFDNLFGSGAAAKILGGE